VLFIKVLNIADTTETIPICWYNQDKNSW